MKTKKTNLILKIKMPLAFMFFLLEGLQKTEAVAVTGVEGQMINIECSHANAQSNIKYFCKGACRNEDILITSTKMKEQSNSKYSLKDNGNTFYVTISHLTKDDSGTYYCGIERVGLDTYNEVLVTVIEGETMYSDEAVNKSASSSVKLVYIGVGLCVAVLVLMMALWMFFKYRKRDISASSGKDLSSLSVQKQDTCHGITTSSDIKDEETRSQTDPMLSPFAHKNKDTSAGHMDNIYSNVTVSTKPLIQPDTLMYSTLTFSKDVDCSTSVSHTDIVTYAAINHIPQDESTFYCKI
ncbi:uncharacterized protein KZ484_023834 isoform 1-T2 [Pholidichthys leucotaenia]